MSAATLRSARRTQHRTVERAGQLLGLHAVRRVHDLTGCAFFTMMIIAVPVGLAVGAIAAIAAIAG